MRAKLPLPLPLLPVLLLLLAPPSATAAKDLQGPVRVSWNGAPPADTPVGGTWDARFTLHQGPGGYDLARPVHPVVVVTDLESGTTRRIHAVVDGAPHAFRADVPFGRAGAYQVALAEFDPRRPRAIASWGPVRIGPPAGTDGDDSPAWPWILGGLIAVSALGGASVALLRAAGPARSAGPPATGL